MRALRTGIPLVIVLLVAAACVSAGPLPGPVATTQALVSPLALGGTPQTLNSPLNPPDAHEVIPTQDAARATIVGQLLINTAAPRPITDTILYLGGLVTNAAGTPTAASMDRISSPRTATDMSGNFRFDNVPPGRYVLVVARLTSSYMLRDPKTGYDMVFEARAGQVLDLGKLVYESLPDEAP